MRIFKIVFAWIGAFIIASFGSLVFHGTLGTAFTIAQLFLVMLIAWPVVMRIMFGICAAPSAMASKSVEDFNALEQLKQAQRSQE
jgi:hypothetical protein